VKEIIEFCVKAHDGQNYGPFDYVFHLHSVANVARMYGLTNNIIIQACYGHDLLEDTEVTEDDLVNLFHPAAIDIIKRVTDEPGKNRKERKAKTYPKIKGHSGATIVKLCDRIANVSFTQASGNGNLLQMYKKEHESFIDGIGESIYIH
jgi:(p)ppGpp synthase/HD superfamily hydrolase